jgi:hypothetical protein
MEETPAGDPLPAEDPVDSAEGFFSSLAAAFRAGDSVTLYDALHPAVIDLYGEEACRGALDRGPDESAAIEVVDAEGPGPFEWTIDGVTTSIEDALTVNVTRTAAGETSSAEAHIAFVDTELRWFTDCGEPLP